MIMHAGLFSAARGNEILIGKPMPLKMDQGYPGHWTVRDAANVCHTEWSSGGAAEFYGWKYSTVVPASHSGFEFSAPHDIVVGDVTIPASGNIARCATITEPVDVPGCPVPVVRQHFGAVDGLPDPAPETIYVVSMVCAQAVGDAREDVYVPGEQIRDDAGRIIGCRSLAKLAGSRREVAAQCP